jgi:hypothetical protein
MTMNIDKLRLFARFVQEELRVGPAQAFQHGNGRFALTWPVQEAASWQTTQGLCRDFGIPQPDNMRVDLDDPGMHVTCFWGMAG